MPRQCTLYMTHLVKTDLKGVVLMAQEGKAAVGMTGPSTTGTQGTRSFSATHMVAVSDKGPARMRSAPLQAAAVSVSTCFACGWVFLFCVGTHKASTCLVGSQSWALPGLVPLPVLCQAMHASTYVCSCQLPAKTAQGNPSNNQTPTTVPQTCVRKGLLCSSVARMTGMMLPLASSACHDVSS